MGTLTAVKFDGSCTMHEHVTKMINIRQNPFLGSRTFIVFHISSLYFYFETLHPCTFIFI